MLTYVATGLKISIFKITVHGTTHEMLADKVATESSFRSITEAFKMFARPRELL